MLTKKYAPPDGINYGDPHECLCQTCQCGNCYEEELGHCGILSYCTGGRGNCCHKEYDCYTAGMNCAA